MEEMKMSIFKELEKIVEDNERYIAGFATKIFIISEMKSYEIYEYLKDEVKEKLYYYIYSYWIENDFVENHLSDIIWLVFSANSNIIKNINKINYQEFKKIMDKLV